MKAPGMNQCSFVFGVLLHPLDHTEVSKLPFKQCIHITMLTKYRHGIQAKMRMLGAGLLFR